jgi:thiamine biosynthesis lipoprotein
MMPGFLAVALAAGSFAASARPAAGAGGCDGLERARAVMGTTARVVVCDAAGEAAAEAASAALDAIERVDRTMSLYRPESDLSRLNREGFPGPVLLDPDLVSLLAESRTLSEETGGRFDVTVKPLMDHYGFYRDLGFEAPPDGLPGALRRVGWSRLRVDAAASTASFGAAGMGVDLGGIAKGFALDRARAVLRERGIHRALIDLGRQLMFLGPGPGPAGRWVVGIVDPRDDGRLLGEVEVPEGSLSTSAPSGRLVPAPAEAGGATPRSPVGHVLDPARGAVRGGPLQATVWSPSATRADALSTALLLAGSQEARRRLQATGEAAVFVERAADCGPGARLTAAGALRGGPERFVVEGRR